MINAIQGKILAPKNIINLIEGIRSLIQVKDISINYCNRVCNRNADRIARNAHKYVACTSGYFFDKVSFLC